MESEQYAEVLRACSRDTFELAHRYEQYGEVISSVGILGNMALMGVGVSRMLSGHRKSGAAMVAVGAAGALETIRHTSKAYDMADKYHAKSRWYDGQATILEGQPDTTEGAGAGE